MNANSDNVSSYPVPGSLQPEGNLLSSAFATAAASSASASAMSMNITFSGSDDDNDETMPWEEDGWVPRTKSGQQKTPNMVSVKKIS